MFQRTIRSDPFFLLQRSWALIIISFIFMALGGFIFGVVFVQAIKSILFGNE